MNSLLSIQNRKRAKLVANIINFAISIGIFIWLGLTYLSYRHWKSNSNVPEWVGWYYYVPYRRVERWNIKHGVTFDQIPSTISSTMED